jgi:hypothetical protein
MKLSFYRSVCDKPGKGDVMSMCVRGINFVSSYDFSARFWNCFDSVVFFVFLLDFGTVSTVWYFLLFILLRYFTTIIPVLIK